jgi:hypothetical protein
MEHEKERGGGVEEKAQDECCADTSTKRFASNSPTECRLGLTSLYAQDLTELDLPSTMVTHFPDPGDLLNFTLTITPDEGMPVSVRVCILCLDRHLGQACTRVAHSFSPLSSI